jgi:hypothetical protein
MRIGLQGPTSHAINGLYIAHSTHALTLSSSLPSAPGPGTTKGFGAIKRVASANRRSQEGAVGRREAHTGVLGSRAGLRALLRRAGVAKRAGAGVR